MVAMKQLLMNSEGCNEGIEWPEPKTMATTRGSDREIRMAVDTVKTALGKSAGSNRSQA